MEFHGCFWRVKKRSKRPKKGKKGQKRAKKGEFSWGFVERKGGRVRGGSNPPTFSRSGKVRSAPTRINTKSAIFLTWEGPKFRYFSRFLCFEVSGEKREKRSKRVIFIDFQGQKKVKKIAFFSDERRIPQKLYSTKKVKKSDSSQVLQKVRIVINIFINLVS